MNHDPFQTFPRPPSRLDDRPSVQRSPIAHYGAFAVLLALAALYGALLGVALTGGLQ